MGIVKYIRDESVNSVNVQPSKTHNVLIGFQLIILDIINYRMLYITAQTDCWFENTVQAGISRPLILQIGYGHYKAHFLFY